MAKTRYKFSVSKMLSTIWYLSSGVVGALDSCPLLDELAPGDPPADPLEKEEEDCGGCWAFPELLLSTVLFLEKLYEDELDG